MSRFEGGKNSLEDHLKKIPTVLSLYDTFIPFNEEV